MSWNEFFCVAILFVVVLSQAVPGVNTGENTEEVDERDVTVTNAKHDTQANGQHEALPMSMRSRSGYGFNAAQECNNYTNLSSPDRAQGAIVLSNYTCDTNLLTPGWYRFTGDAGNKMASTCVPTMRCGTLATGWMNGNHPTANGSIVERQVCFNWLENCCELGITIRVRHCGDFYIYQFPYPPVCKGRYCGNALGPQNTTSECGGNLTNLTGQITSPGYPDYMEPITCHWTIKAPLNGKILLYFEDLTFSHGGCTINNITIDNDVGQTFCRTMDPFSLISTEERSLSIYYKSAQWNMKSGFKLRYAFIKGHLNNADVQNKWNTNVQVSSSNVIQVSWRAFNDSFLKPDQYVYGYAVMCKPVNQRSVYVLTKPDAVTINVSGLTGGTVHSVQVLALVAERNNKPTAIHVSVITTIRTNNAECQYYTNLTTKDRGQGAQGGNLCDQDFTNHPAWYRYGGEAGIRIATSCVAKRRCGTASPGWMMGTHPSLQDGIVTRTVCFHWLDSCCLWNITIKVRNCGGFYVYELRQPPLCQLRYCGNQGGCGKVVNNTTGNLTSPGYPQRIYWNSKCQWSFTAPSPSGVIVVVVEHLSIPVSARCLIFHLSFENGLGIEVGKACGIHRFFTWLSTGFAKLKFHSSRATSRWLGFQARYFIFKGSLTDIPDILQWTGVSAQAINSTAMNVQWDRYPVSPVSPPITEYIIICVPDGLPLNATVFTTDVSQNALVVTGLMKFANYTVQIVVQKGSSFDDYRGSHKARVRTAEDVPSQGPTNISVRASASSYTITVSWQPIPKQARNGIILHYVIYYKKAWTSENWAGKTISNIDVEDKLMTTYLKGLDSATEYRIEMAGATSVGVGTRSKPVFATTGCNDFKLATKNQLTWSFSSPRYPDNYLSKLNCTWRIESKSFNLYVVFDAFHVEKADPCSDYVLITQAVGNRIKQFCGKKDPFAVQLSKGTSHVQLKTDGGLEESGFHAKVFVVTSSNTLQISYVKISSQIGTYTMKFLLNEGEELKGDIVEYLVLYKTANSNDQIWNATTTKTNKAILTGLEHNEYQAFILIHTTMEVYRGSPSPNFRPLEPAATPPPNVAEATHPPTAQTDLPMYPYGESANVGDSILPNTAYYSTRCLRVVIPDDGIQFFQKRHHMIHICRNGLLPFETPQLIRWPYRFSEQRPWLRNAAMLAPYWALTDVEDSFVTLNVSKVFYQVYKDTDSSWRSKEILHQATYDVNKFYKPNEKKYELETFVATWVLKVTWVDLRFPDATKLSTILKNTFQAVIITDGIFSFAMYNYPTNGIQWSAPTEKRYYSLFSKYHGLPVVGFNSGEHNRKVQRHYDVIGSGTPGIKNVNQVNGATIYSTSNINSWAAIIKHKSPGKWVFRLETSLGKERPKKKCIDWFKNDPDHRRFTENLEPCPCTYRQAFWDERFKMDPEESSRICAYTVFASVDGWGQECCYNRKTGALIKGYPDGGTARKSYLRVKKTMKEKEYLDCCIYSNMCDLYYKRRPSNNCSGYEETEWSWLWGDPHFVTLDGRNYTFNGLGEYIMTDISNGLFQLQARTKFVGGGGKATVFFSAVAKQNGTSAVQVSLNSAAGLEVLVNGTNVDPNTVTNTSTRFNGSVAVSRPDNSSIAVLFPSGISVKFTKIKDSLAILLAAPQQFKNKTRGLLGVWNDDPLDDLTTPTGRILPNNATSRMIHFEFGQKWQVTDSNSLFTYKQGENVSTFSDSSFEPTFIEDYKFFNETVKQEALEKCGGDVNCLFDAALTNDVTMGTSTKIVGSRFKNESEALKNNPPKFFNETSVIYVTVNTTARIEILAKDDDGDPLNFNLSGILPEKLDIFTNASGSIVIAWEVTMTKLKMEFTVTDDKEAVALLRPKVRVCACHNGGNCSRDANSNAISDSNDDTFLIMQCNCINGYSGRFCENNLDACQANLNPCYPGVKCTDLPPPAGVFGYTCGPCPKGFTGDGATCTDLNECNGGNDGCSQICVNTPGSFVCDCNQGYRLSINQKTCNDVNECDPISDCMQTCTNTEGSYTCGCNAGFTVDPGDSKKCVPKQPCTDDNHGCQHVCYVEDGLQKCSCRQGFELMEDKKNCRDVDECRTGKYRCTQYCHNNQGGYYCTCKNGFRLDDDGVTCVDVDECMELTFHCPDPSQICLNTAGTYKCVCGPGLYLTVKNTCRELIPGATSPPPKPAPSPKLPVNNEKKNAIEVIIKGLKVSDWNEPLDTSFKQAVAKAVTYFCATKGVCGSKKRRERRALDYILYTADQVHLLPGFPVQINPNSPDLAAVIALYVNFPPGVVSKSGNSIQGKTLVQIVQSAKTAIETSLNKTISDITLFNKEQPSDIPKSSNLYIIIGGLLAGLVFAVIVILLIRRVIAHRKTFHVKRKQEKEERNIRSRGIDNVCYGEFNLYPLATNITPRETTG